MQCNVYDLGCCSPPTAALKTSRLGETTTLAGVLSTGQQPVERRSICSNPCQYESDGMS